jgi:hypothetical protein
MGKVKRSNRSSLVIRNRYIKGIGAPRINVVTKRLVLALALPFIKFSQVSVLRCGVKQSKRQVRI